MENFDYFQNATVRRKIIVISPEDIREISGKGANAVNWLENYPNASEDIDEGLPDPRGPPHSTMVYFDSDHAHNQVMWRLVSGVMFFWVEPNKLFYQKIGCHQDVQLFHRILHR